MRSFVKAVSGTGEVPVTVLSVPTPLGALTTLRKGSDRPDSGYPGIHCHPARATLWRLLARPGLLVNKRDARFQLVYEEKITGEEEAMEQAGNQRQLAP
jgi:hypothetical protein